MIICLIYVTTIMILVHPFVLYVSLSITLGLYGFRQIQVVCTPALKCHFNSVFSYLSRYTVSLIALQLSTGKVNILCVLTCGFGACSTNAAAALVVVKNCNASTNNVSRSSYCFVHSTSSPELILVSHKSESQQSEYIVSTKTRML